MNVIRGERLNVNFWILCTLSYQVSFVNKHLKVEGGNSEIFGGRAEVSLLNQGATDMN